MSPKGSLYVLAPRGNGARNNHPETEDDTMKVNELIEILQDMDPEADVYVMAQPSWPYAERSIMRSAHR